MWHHGAAATRREAIGIFLAGGAGLAFSRVRGADGTIGSTVAGGTEGVRSLVAQAVSVAPSPSWAGLEPLPVLPS
jgi:hypothetical protein